MPFCSIGYCIASITVQPNNLEPSSLNYSLESTSNKYAIYFRLSMDAAGVFTVEGSHRREVGGYPAGLPHTQPEGSGPESEKQGDLGRRTCTMFFYSLPLPTNSVL